MVNKYNFFFDFQLKQEQDSTKTNELWLIDPPQ